MEKAEAEALIEKMHQLELLIANNEKQKVIAMPSGCPSIPLPKAINIHEGDISENFNFFKRSWENYLIASGLESQTEQTKKAVLLTAIGEDIFKRYHNLPFTEDEQATEKLLLEAIGKNLTPVVNKRYERAIFNLAQQESDESYDNYIVRLRGLIRNCQYGELHDDILLDKIICSVKDLRLRERLWLDNKITLATAIDTCRGKEISEKQLKDISQQSSLQEVNRITSKPKLNRNYSSNYSEKKEPAGNLCFYCGRQHAPRECPAKGKTCFICQKADHFANVCQSRRPLKNVNMLSEAGERSSKDERFVLTIQNEDHGILKANIEFCVDEQLQVFKNVSCQLDTGAACNVIGLDSLCNILDDPNPNVNPSQIKLKAYGGKIITPLGEITLKVKFKNKLFNEVFIVTDYDHAPLISSNACEHMQIIQICNLIAPPVVKNPGAIELLKQFDDVFTGLGLVNGEISLEIDDEVKPSAQAPRRVPLAMKDELKKLLQNMVDLGVIVQEENHTDWISNILIVKKNEKFRLCLDPTNLNKALKDSKYQLPIIEEILPMLSKAKVFSTVDAKHGFWQMMLDEKSSKLTTFWTPFGRYRFIRMPFGIKPAMEIYQRIQNEIIQGLDGVYVMADDILIVGRGETNEEAVRDHNRNLEMLLVRLRSSNLKLNKDKVKLCLPEVKYYGHVLTKDGVKPDKEKVSAILNMPAPEDKAGVLRFLGMITYLSKFLPKLSTVSEPLRKLTHISSDFKWDSVHEATFGELKKLVSEITMLSYFDLEKPIVIQTDASSFGMGCVIMQESKIVSCASKALTTTQKNYAQIEKEMLAIVYACHRFDQFICGRKDVTVQTDHNPLINIFKKPLLQAPKRLQSMILCLQRYNLKLKYVRGTEMVLADTLSRAPENTVVFDKTYDIYKLKKVFEYIEEVNILDTIRVRDTTISKIRAATKEDEAMQALKQLIINGWPQDKNELVDTVKCYWSFREELVVVEDLIMKGDRILIPTSLRKDILDRLHTSHTGIEYTTNLARETVFWPNLGEHIKNKIQNCPACLKYAPNQQKEPMQTHEIPKSAFERVNMDCLEIEIDGKKRHFLITADSFSDFFEIDELKDLSAKTTIVVCKRNFSRYGIPLVVVSDNGTNFDNAEFRKFSKDWDFKSNFSSPHHQQGNGKSEATVKVAKQMIKKCVEDGQDFYSALLIHRNTPNKTGYSPAKRLFGRWLRCSLPMVNFSNPEIPKDVPTKIQEEREKAKFYYDKKAKHHKPLQVGDSIYSQIHPKMKVWSPAKVVQLSDDRSVIISSDNTRYRRNNVHIKASNQNQENQLDDTTSDKPDKSVKEELPINQPTPEPLPNSNYIDRPRRVINPPERFKDYYVQKY